jgi:TP901 family phage tail tape measure protein
MRSTDLLARLRLDASQFDKSVKQSQTELQQFARVAGALPGGRNSVFGALATDVSNLAPALSSMPLGIAAVGAALTGAGLAARRAGVEFEASLTKIATLGADAQANLGQTRTAILDTFTSTAITGGVEDLAEANYLLQSSGRSAAEAIVDLDIAAKASVAGYTAVTTAVDGLTTVTAAWKDTQITTAQASDILFQAVNVGKASFEEIASSLGLVAPLAASAGVRFEEVAAASALLSNQGLRTTSIMEGLRSAILNIQRPTEDFKKKYADLAREFGASRLARDGIIQFLRDFNVASNGSQAALTALFSDATGLTTALGLLRNGGNDAAAALKQMQTAAGAADAALATVNQSAKAQEQLIRNQISSAWTQFGELLNTTTLPILEAVARVMNRISNGSNFVARDLQEYLNATGAFARSSALQSLLKQQSDDPDGFLRAIPTAQIAPLRQRLLTEADREQVPVSLVEALRAEAARREAASRAESRRTAAASSDARTAAQVRAADEQAQRDRDAAAARAATATTEAKQQAEALARQRQRLVDDAAKLTTQLEATAIEALQGTAGALQSAMEQALSEGARLLASGALSPEAKAALTAQLEQFEALQQQLIDVERDASRTQEAIDSALATEMLPASEAIAARERELLIILEGTTNLAARKKIQEQLNALAAARGESTSGVFGLPAGDEIRSQIAVIGDLTQSLATLGDQLGLLPQQAVNAVRGIGALVEQGAKLADISKAGGFSALKTSEKLGIGLGIAGGVASFAGALLGSTAEDVARREALRANTEAIRTLTQNIGDLSNAAVSGRSLSRVLAAARTPGLALGNLQRDAAGTLANTGFASRSEIEEVARALGVTLNGARSVADLIAAITQADLASYTDTFAGSIQRLNDTISADGITDPIEIFRRRIATLVDPKTGFPALATALDGLDLSTAEGRSEASTRARALFDDLAGGRISAAQLGGLSIADARQAILDVITGTRDIAGGTGTGGFNETRTITEVTGNRLAGLFSSANQFLRQIAEDIAVLRSTIVVSVPATITAPSLGSVLSGAASGPTVVIQSLTIQLTLTRDLLGADSATAVALGDTLARRIGSGLVGEIDAQLRDRELRQRLLLGNPVLS